MPAPAELTVAVDVTSLIGVPTGVGAMVTQLVEGLSRRPDVIVRGFAVTWRGRGELPGTVSPGTSLVTRPMAARPLRWAWRRGDRPVIETWAGPVDVVHGPNFVVPPARRAAQVVTIHDLTPWRFPELVAEATSDYPDLVARALDRGAWVHTPSQWVADELVEVVGARRERIAVIPLGAPDLGPDGPGRDAAAGRHRAGAERYVLAVGTVEPRKDLPGLVAAFDALAAGDPGLRLVLAGPYGWGAAALDQAVASARHRDRVVRTGWVDDDTRAGLLRGAAVVAYPSLYEGFGLVPLEGMAAGVPVVTTRAGAIPEVVGDAAELVDVGDVDALAGALGRVLTDEDRRAELVAAGHHRRLRFSWADTVDAMVALYRRAAAARA